MVPQDRRKQKQKRRLRHATSPTLPATACERGDIEQGWARAALSGERKDRERKKGSASLFALAADLDFYRVS